MPEIIKLLIGVIVLSLGIPLGEYLKYLSKDELKPGQIWFKILTSMGILGGIVGLIIQVDWVLFTFLFIAVVTSRSLIYEKKNAKTKKKK